MIVWRGLGILAILIPLGWWLAIVFVFVAAQYYEPDHAKAAAMVYRTFALGFALGALTLWPIARRRARTAPGIDHLAFVPMKFWPALIGLTALAALIASFVPAALRAF